MVGSGIHEYVNTRIVHFVKKKNKKKNLKNIDLENINYVAVTV